MKQIITIFTLCLMNFTFAQDKNARASMEVDGKEIYTAKDLRVGLFTSTDDF